MRTQRCAFFGYTLVIFVLAGIFGPSASGTSVTGSFVGTFLGGTGSVPSGIGPTASPPNSAIHGSFGYSTSDFTRSGSASSGYTYTLTSYTTTDVLAFTVGTGTAWNDYYVSGAGSSFTILMTTDGKGSQMKITSTTATGGDLSYLLTSTSYGTITALPTQISQVASFQGATGITYNTPDPWGTLPDQMVMGQDFTGGANAVPEPSSIALAVMSLGTLTVGLLVSRRTKKVA